MTDATIIDLQAQRDQLQAALRELLKHSPAPTRLADLYGIARARAQKTLDDVEAARLAALRTKLRDEYAEGLDAPPG